MGAADGLPDAFHRPQLLRSDRPGGFGLRGCFRGGVVRRGAGHSQRAALGRDDVSFARRAVRGIVSLCRGFL